MLTLLNEVRKMGGKWTAEEIEKLKEMLESCELTGLEIAQELGRSEFSVESKIKSLGWLLRPKPIRWRRWSKEEDNQLTTMRSEGRSWWEIAQELGRSTSTCMMRRNYLKNPKKTKKQEEVGDRENQSG